MQPVDRYLDRVLAAAGLSWRDERAVREELEGHLADLADAARLHGLTPEETYEMVEREFGNAEEVGSEIARAKGRFRTYLKKQALRVPIALAVAVGVALVIRWQVAEVYHVPTASMAPAIPADAKVVVNKWADVGQGDLVVFRDDDRSYVARVDRLDDASAVLTKLNVDSDLSAEWPKTVERDRVVGRVWLVSR
jgi:hypothetical protein